MFYSLYPTDTEEMRENIIKQANKNNIDTFFVSLHIPEAEKLKNFIAELELLHKQYSYKYFADISPLTFKQLEIDISEINQLKKYGIIGLRLDFGIDYDYVQKFIEYGFKVALNASTVTKEILEKYKGLEIIGWHNFYPRPNTAMSEAYLIRQNELLQAYNIPIWGFMPGDKYRRMPLHLGLPMLEKQRNQNSYVSYVESIKKYHFDNIGVAEGILNEEELSYIIKFYHDKIITLPLIYENEKIKNILFQENYDIRIEESEYIWRLEDTRKYRLLDVFSEIYQKLNFFRGDIVMDSAKYGRYKGEISLVKKNNDVLDMYYIAKIKSDYLILLELLGNHQKILFV